MVVFQTEIDLWIRTGTEHEAVGRVHEAPSLETDSHGGRDTLHCTAQSGHQRRRPALWRTLNKSAVHCRPSKVKGSRHSLVTGTVAASARLSPPPPPHRPTSHCTGLDQSHHGTGAQVTYEDLVLTGQLRAWQTQPLSREGKRGGGKRETVITKWVSQSLKILIQLMLRNTASKIYINLPWTDSFHGLVWQRF